MKLGRPNTTDAASLGMRRVDWVRITVGDGGTVAEAVGVGHRQPCTRSLPLPLAARLTAEGVPFLVHHTETTSDTNGSDTNGLTNGSADPGTA